MESAEVCSQVLLGEQIIILILIFTILSYLLMFILFFLYFPAELSQKDPMSSGNFPQQAGNSLLLRPCSSLIKSTSIQHVENITKAVGQSWPRAIIKGGGICASERRGKSFDLD